MAIFLINLTPHDLQLRLNEALAVYIAAMGYPRSIENQRAGVWLEHALRPGWQAVAAVETAVNSTDQNPSASELNSAPLLGVAYGYPGAPEHWWQQQVIIGLRHNGFPPAAIDQLMTSYFELTELHIHPGAQGRGLGEALTRRLLSNRKEKGEKYVLLSTPETTGEPNRAWRLYRRLGFADVIRNYHFTGDPRAFAILGRPLPLE